ncbi:hypothetical protein M409DRAFT_62435 [Zasmidium cellare ATCC 36951]|uniref:Cytochrome P450 n=1 Tax=Zasmidium cellare ATCC 36951 TaxID=1080233 RepID=A0A6A6D009_ZASCE|nr:uncharacterized protein M409DRAFT_62435 [Zasmidium cellare ATCC 36951]KAF2172711.1 hypothetical protein M409DRAFT_62435 [Zasmidium cellare ATCC 36951]
METLLTIIRSVPTPILYALSPFAAIAVILALTRVITTVNYYRALQQFKDSPHGGQKIVSPPQIPYTIPWLGNSLDFLRPSPGAFWSELFSYHPRETGVCTLLMGGRKSHIVFSPTTVQAIFKARTPSRDIFDFDLYIQVFKMTHDQAQNAYNGKHSEEVMNSKYMIKFERVNELTEHFTKSLEDVLSKDSKEIVEKGEIGLYEWLRDRMFTASCYALMGEKLKEMYPNFCEDFYGFDGEFLKFFFRFPEFLIKDAYQRRDRIFDNLEKWSAEMHRLSGGTPVDPEGPAWEPFFGSRLNRARHLDYKARGLNSRSSAALDLGITFAISSNAIPATGWMLFHLLNPKNPSLLERALKEINAATKEDGNLDIATLVSQPLLQSLWTETLRLYADVLVTRNLPEDITLPLDESGKHHVLFRAGDNVFAPSFLGHRDDNVWSTEDAPYDVFHADRFLVKDPKTGQEAFSMSRTTGKFFPFGGGKTICPGRIFAKQEAIGALAMVLLKFDFDVKGYIDIDKKPTKDFPGMPKAFPGSGALSPGGDMKVKISRRVW